MRRVLLLLMLVTAFILSFFPVQANVDQANVYVIPIKNDITSGLYAYLNRAISTAEENKADLIIFDMDTNGGIVDSAVNIANRILKTDIRTITFVNSRSISAGSFIALHTDEIFMTPNATMGASAIIDQSGNTAGDKAESFWIAAMTGAAKQKNRNPKIAEAMVDGDVDLPELKKKGDLLTLTADNALKVGYAEGIVKDIDELLESIGFQNAAIHTVPQTFSDHLAQFITNPIVIPILLSIASIGLVVELYSPGFGLPGIMGISSLLLFFYGHYISGLAGYESLILFIIGVLLIILEFFIAGGIAGILGILAILASIIFAGTDIIYMIISVFISIFLAIIVIIIMLKVFDKRMKFFRRLILTDATTSEKGYVSNVNRLDLIGKKGIAQTDLRPAGIVLVDDEKLDVVADGTFIEKGSKIKIIKTEGTRIVVRKIRNEEE